MKYPDSCGLGVTFPRKQTFQISKTMLELSLSKTTAFQSGEN